jgi:hypothetical protein
VSVSPTRHGVTDNIFPLYHHVDHKSKYFPTFDIAVPFTSEPSWTRSKRFDKILLVFVFLVVITFLVNRNLLPSVQRQMPRMIVQKQQRRRIRHTNRSCFRRTRRSLHSIIGFLFSTLSLKRRRVGWLITKLLYRRERPARPRTRASFVKFNSLRRNWMQQRRT